MKKKGFVCNVCGFAYSEEDIRQEVNERTGDLENHCDNCGSFDLEPVYY